MKDANFPIEWTSTQLEGAVSGLCDAIGFDVPLSVRVMNQGAPRFIFRKDHVNIQFNMQVDVFSQDYSEKYLEIHYKNLEIDFFMTLDENDCQDKWKEDWSPWTSHSCSDQVKWGHCDE